MWYDELGLRKVDDGYLFFADFGGAYRITKHQKEELVALSNWNALTLGLATFPVPIVAYFFGLAAGLIWMALPSLLFSFYRMSRHRHILKQAPRTDEKPDRSIRAVRERLRALPRLMPWWNVGVVLGVGLYGLAGSLFFASTSHWDGPLKTLATISCLVCVMSLLLAALKWRRANYFGVEAR